MTITVISPGKTREAWLQAALDEYIRRLSRYCKVRMVTVPDAPDSREPEKAKDDEGRGILAKIKPRDFVVALDLGGRQLDSLQLSENLMNWLEKGGSSVTFVIGGASGLASQVLTRAQDRLCLSRMTFTHQMTRLILLEQCYRGFRLLNNEPYHKF